MLELIIIPIIVGFITQAIKLIIDGIPNNFNWQHMIGDYGGMPSSHTAFVASLVTVVGISQGINSATFAIALVLLAVVARDALGFRTEIGKNAQFTNLVAKQVFKNKKASYLNEKMGHTLLEVTIGLLTGVILSLIIYPAYLYLVVKYLA